MNHTEKVTAIAVLEIAMHDALAAEARTNNAAIDAREAGATWEQIGRVLGITKQRAQQKYGHRTTPEAKAERERQAEQTDEMFFKETAAMLAESDKKEPETTSIFLEATAPAKAPRKRKPNATTTQRGYTDSRPAFKLASAGKINDTAQPGTGKGPHQCPRCGSTNHKGGTDEIRAYFDCTPTKYDPQDITDYLNKTGLTK